MENNINDNYNKNNLPLGGRGGHIYLITGGQRSGKSTKAEELALSLSPNPVYMATAHIWDDEFRERVARHQARRGPNWTNIEEELYPSHHDISGKVVLIDCCTLWATNFFFRDSKGDELPDVDKTLAELKEEFDRFTSQDATFIFVTNEIGLGGVSANAVQRRFTDLMGWFNQYIAQKADEVIMMVSGVAMKIKEPQPLTCPSGILSPRGEEEVTNNPSKESSQAIKGNFSLAPWGEGVRRTGEGLCFFLPHHRHKQSLTFGGAGDETIDWLVPAFEQRACDIPFFTNLNRDKFCSKSLTNPFHVLFILMQIEGTGAVNQHTTIIKARPYILYDASLERRTLHHVLKTPLPYRIMILTEHSLARTWHIAYYQVKRKS